MHDNPRARTRFHPGTAAPWVLERCSIRKVEGRAHISEEIKKSHFAFALVAVFADALLAQSVGEKTGVNSALGIAPKTEDFIKEAAMSDMTEIEAAKIAQQKGNADEKKFAGNDAGRPHENQHRTQVDGPGQP